MVPLRGRIPEEGRQRPACKLARRRDARELGERGVEVQELDDA